MQLEWIIEKALEKDPNLRYQTIADLRVDLQRLKTALESGRLMTAASDAGPAANVVIERELTDDSREVAAMSGVSRVTLGIGVAAAIVLGVAMSYYHLARPGADLPLLVPKGAVLTKARDTVESFGYSGLGSRTNVEFIDAVDVETITAMAGLAAAREAIREGTPVAYWRAGITHTGRSHRVAARRPPAIIPFASTRRARSSRLRPAMRPTATSRTPIARKPHRLASRRSRERSASTRPATSSKSWSAPSPPARPR